MSPAPEFEFALQRAINVRIRTVHFEGIDGKALRQADIERCPKHSLLQKHYHGISGDCRCAERVEAMKALETLRTAEACLKRKRQAAQRWVDAC